MIVVWNYCFNDICPHHILSYSYVYKLYFFIKFVISILMQSYMTFPHLSGFLELELSTLKPDVVSLFYCTCVG